MKGALANAASLLRPTEVETLLLRACLATGSEVETAWNELSRRVARPVNLFRRDRGDLRRLGPLLHVSLREAGVDVDPDTSGRLRLSLFREELRSREVGRITRAVLESLGEAGHRPVVLRGAALGRTIYDDPALRHSHDLELLLPEDGAVAEAASALAGSDLTPVGSPDSPESGDRVLEHPTGMPVVLRSRLFASPHVSLASEEIMGRTERARIAGTEARVLAPAEALVAALGGAALRSGRSSLQWACDVSLLTRRRPELDWERFRRLARDARLLVPSLTLLEYVHRRLPSSVPEEVLEGMSRGAREVAPLDRDVLLFGLRSTLPGGLRELLARCGGWGTRARVLGWILFPSTEYLRQAYGESTGGSVRSLYLTRPLSFVAERGGMGAGLRR